VTIALYGLERAADDVATLRITTDETPHVGDTALTALTNTVDVIKRDPCDRR
jgi:polyketide biosynthesis enoyl-CoA hydratase PksI